MLLKAPLCAQDSYRALALDLVKSAQQSGVKSVAVLPFAWDNSSGSDGRHETSLLTAQLVKTGRLQVIERESLDKILAEQRLLATGAVGQKEFAQTVGQIVAVDALIQGKIYSAVKATELHIRMVAVASGRVLYAGHREIDEPPMNFDRMMDFLAPVPVFKVTAPDLPRAAQTAPAPDVLMMEDCQDQEKKRDQLERSILEIKARFWAGRMLEPGFSAAHLKRNPGSEIVNEDIRRLFYERLTFWYEAGYSPLLDPQEWALMEEVEKKLEKMETLETCAPDVKAAPPNGKFSPADLPGVRPRGVTR